MAESRPLGVRLNSRLRCVTAFSLVRTALLRYAKSHSFSREQKKIGLKLDSGTELARFIAIHRATSRTNDAPRLTRQRAHDES